MRAGSMSAIRRRPIECNSPIVQHAYRLGSCLPCSGRSSRCSRKSKQSSATNSTSTVAKSCVRSPTSRSVTVPISPRDDACAVLLRRWYLQRREQLAAAMHGSWRAELRELVNFLSSMRLDNGAELIDLVRRSGWRAAPRDLRYLILHETDLAIIKVRVAHGLDPIDDGLPAEPKTAFQVVREYLFGDDGVAAAASPSECGTTRRHEQ